MTQYNCTADGHLTYGNNVTVWPIQFTPTFEVASSYCDITSKGKLIFSPAAKNIVTVMGKTESRTTTVYVFGIGKQ